MNSALSTGVNGDAESTDTGNNDALVVLVLVPLIKIISFYWCWNELLLPVLLGRLLGILFFPSPLKLLLLFLLPSVVLSEAAGDEYFLLR